MVGSILCQLIKPTHILHDRLISLFQTKEFLKLYEHDSIRNEMSTESFMKLYLGHIVTSWLCGKKVCPPSSCSTSELLGCEHGLLIISAVNEIKLLLHGAKPVICFQWFICPGEHWRMGISEVHISGLISIVITTVVALWCILIILGHFSQ
jgi:hypothetical protein